MSFGPGGSSNRRRIAILVVAIGGAVIAATVSKDYPREQPLVFRLTDPRAVTLTASFTKLGEAEARTGFTLTLPDRNFRDVNHAVRLPNGDYIVTIELRRPAPTTASPDGGPAPLVGAGAPTNNTNGAPTNNTNGAPTNNTNAGPTPTRLSEETSVSERVSLSGSEVVVSVPARASE